MEEVRQKSWFGRNWIWVVPLGGCLTLIIIGIIFIGTLFFGVTNMFKNSTPYEYALEQASHNPEVAFILGNPIEADGMISGNISIKNNTGIADFSIPIKGSKGTGRIVVVAEKKDGEWMYEKLYVLIKETQEEINLLKSVLEHI
jgi:hypothetical protein